MKNRMNKRYVDIDDVLDLFEISDEDIYAKGVINDALYDGMLKVYKLLPIERRGRWIDVEPAPWGQVYETCSECKTRQTLDKGQDKFCGVCGARME